MQSVRSIKPAQGSGFPAQTFPWRAWTNSLHADSRNLQTAEMTQAGRLARLIEQNEPVTWVGKEESGCVIYLPPCSPNFNPIEEAFSVLKYYLKRNKMLVHCDNTLRAMVKRPVPQSQRSMHAGGSETVAMCNINVSSSSILYKVSIEPSG
jgi:hypothetical protein